MASNEIPRSYDPLVELMEDAADGAATHGAAIGLAQNTEANIRNDLTPLVGIPGTPGLKGVWNAAKADKIAKTGLLRTEQSNGRALLMTCIGTLKTVFGQKWSSQWNAVGFTDNSLAVPANPMVKLQQLRAFYTSNPAREVANVNGIACTAANCEAVAQAISDASDASNQSNTDAGTAQANLEAGIATGRRRMTGLREELGQLIEDDDERWYAFGFDKPSDPTTPEVPENLTVTPGPAGSGSLFCNCDDARRADKYRFVVTNMAGTKLAEKLAEESEAMFTGLTVGATVKVTVTGYKTGGPESQPSPVVQAVVPWRKKDKRRSESCRSAFLSWYAGEGRKEAQSLIPAGRGPLGERSSGDYQNGEGTSQGFQGLAQFAICLTRFHQVAPRSFPDQLPKTLQDHL
jgi:hypothetical protein